MGRPKGSKDLKKRKSKVFITAQQEREIVKDYNSGVPPLDIRNKYSISEAQLINIWKLCGGTVQFLGAYFLVMKMGREEM